VKNLLIVCATTFDKKTKKECHMTFFQTKYNKFDIQTDCKRMSLEAWCLIRIGVTLDVNHHRKAIDSAKKASVWWEVW